MITFGPLSVNIFSYLISGSIGTKTHRKRPLCVLAKISFKYLLINAEKKCSKQVTQFKLCRNDPWLTLYQIPSSHVDWLKNVATSAL